LLVTSNLANVRLATETHIAGENFNIAGERRFAGGVAGENDIAGGVAGEILSRLLVDTSSIAGEWW